MLIIDSERGLCVEEVDTYPGQLLYLGPYSQYRNINCHRVSSQKRQGQPIHFEIAKLFQLQAVLQFTSLLPIDLLEITCISSIQWALSLAQA